jgi:DNA invertase Pin-like site-specific DNA recombinase
MRAALYARTSTAEQSTDNQIPALRDFCARRGWSVVLEYVDAGISGTVDERPALDAMRRDARRGRFDVVVAWRLDRVGRSLRALVMFLDELQLAGIAFASVDDGIDLSTPAGRFMGHVLAALAEYERAVIVERVRLGLARARRQGTRLGRPPSSVTREQLAAVNGLSLSNAARTLNVSRSAVAKWRKGLQP